MSNAKLTKAHVVRGFIILALFVVIAWREPLGVMELWPPTSEPLCDCDTDLDNCSDFATEADAQHCLDHCWTLGGLTFTRWIAMRMGRRVRRWTDGAATVQWTA